MDRLQGFLLNVCMICSFIHIIAKVIDWHNPYMDFSGRIFWTQIVMCAGTWELICYSLWAYIKKHIKKFARISENPHQAEYK